MSSEVQTYLGRKWEVIGGPLDGAVGRCTYANHKRGVAELKIARADLWPSMRYQYRAYWGEIFGDAGFCLATVDMSQLKLSK